MPTFELTSIDSNLPDKNPPYKNYKANNLKRKLKTGVAKVGKRSVNAEHFGKAEN